MREQIIKSQLEELPEDLKKVMGTGKENVYGHR